MSNIVEVVDTLYTDRAYEELSGYKVCSRCSNKLELCFFRKKLNGGVVGASGKVLQRYTSFCKVCENNCSLKLYYKKREQKLEYQRKLQACKRDEYRASRNANGAMRRARKLRATPNWLTKTDREEISSFYKKREELSTDNTHLHVDHIVPLNGLTVCGLHVPWNLRIINKQENLCKTNKLDDELLKSLYDGYCPTELTTELQILLKSFK